MSKSLTGRSAGDHRQDDCHHLRVGPRDQLPLRSRYRIEVIAIRDIVSDKINMIPGTDCVIKDGDVLVVVGKEKDIQQIR
ncbi:MAG: hypothetical protein AUK26_10320 [Syntrophaceae bacterium CG2_30_58_14]|nr:MAG: hypothetical protein AUK26_10320 [Syntrophaceae bacterium CG2_30_58_14]